MTEELFFFLFVADENNESPFVPFVTPRGGGVASRRGCVVYLFCVNLTARPRTRASGAGIEPQRKIVVVRGHCVLELNIMVH